jgi:NAD(P)-dependent dehydrogenase (short-subunit alcohol dehydrogenase family)
MQYIHSLARALASQRVRVNAVHPTNCDTDMLHNEALYRLFRPDLEDPTRDDALEVLPTMTAMGVPWVDPVDISNAIVFLASDDARYITGVQLRVDAGFYTTISSTP